MPSCKPSLAVASTRPRAIYQEVQGMKRPDCCLSETYLENPKHEPRETIVIEKAWVGLQAG